MDGFSGSVVIPSIGLTIGTMASWTLTRREETLPELGVWDLRVSFSYVNEHAWNSNKWEKKVELVLGHPKRGKKIQVSPTVGRTVLSGTTLFMDGVNILQ